MTWNVEGVGDVPEAVMDEACRTGWVPPGPWAGEGYWLPEGADPSQGKISQILADRILADCPRYLAAKAAEPSSVPSWVVPAVLVGGLALLLWRR